MSRIFRRAGLAAALALLTSLGAGAAGASAASGPGGRNDWSCKPSAEHPDPVVVLHGFLGNRDNDLGGSLGVALKNNGYCEFDLNYGQPVSWIGVGGITDVAASARKIAEFINQVLRATGAEKVGVAGHSEGGMLATYIPKMLPGMKEKIRTVVGIAASTHGTSFAGAMNLADWANVRPQVNWVLKAFGCTACTQLITGSPMIRALTTGPIAQPGITYTMIASRTDALVTPHDTATTEETGFIREPGVTNLYVQDVCPKSIVGHLFLAYDPSVMRMALNAFDPANAVPVRCDYSLPF